MSNAQAAPSDQPWVAANAGRKNRCAARISSRPRCRNAQTSGGRARPRGSHEKKRAIAVRLVGRCVGNLTTVGSVETKPLAGRVAIVTGGTRGLGLEIARAYTDAGARVLAFGRGDADVTDPEACAALVERAGPVTVLVNNAGVLGPAGPLDDNDWDAWVETVRVNLLGTVRCAAPCCPGCASAATARSSTCPAAARPGRGRTSAPTRRPRPRWCGSRRRSRASWTASTSTRSRPAHCRRGCSTR